ncbi:hypothetical protein D3C85_932010 [compost metagenome]
MRNTITYSALAALITLGAVSSGLADQAKSPAQGSTDATKQEEQPMMEGQQMQMMDMMQEMSTMVKNCNAMMANMHDHMDGKAAPDDKKSQ